MADPSPILVFIAGPLLGQTISLAPGTIHLGRDGSCEVPLLDTVVSRRHSSLTFQLGAPPILKDLESRNGTFVNGVPVREAPLSPGDEVRLGASIFLLQLSGGVPAPLGGTSERTIVQTAGMRWHSREQREEREKQGRGARELEALLAISTALQGEPGVESVARRLLLALQSALRAQNCSVVLFLMDCRLPRGHYRSKAIHR